MRGRIALMVVTLAVLAHFVPRHVRAQGQGVYGAITGSVTDPSGGAVPNAKITAMDIATHVETTVASNSAGYYTVANLIAGTYNVEVSATGFRIFRMENIIVNIGGMVRLDATLVVGDVQQRVTVSATPPALQSEKVELTGTITSTELASIPTAYHNATGFVKLLPGVIEPPGENGLPSSSGNGYFPVMVNGGRSQQNLQRLDGVVDTEFVGGSSSVVPPLDALESVTAAMSNYDVEFGNAQGVVTSMTTKSGTNQWHGTAFEFNQVNATSARNPFTEPVSTGHFVWNQFGGTAGGPIKKDKLFVFGGYQGTRIRSGAPVLTTVPTAAFRTGDFSSLASSWPIFDPATGNPDGTGRTRFVGNIIPPNRISPVAIAALQGVPLPNRPGTDENFVAPLGSYTSDNSAYGRVDWVINNSNRLFGRYTRNWQSSACTNVTAFGSGPQGSSLGDYFCTVAPGSEDFISVDYVHVFTPTFVLEARFGDMIYRWHQDGLDGQSKASDTIGQPGLNDACPACGGLAGFIIGGPVGAFEIGNGNHSHQQNNEGNYEYVGIATWTRGTHTLKFGLDMDLGNDHRFDTASHGNFGCDNTAVCDGNGFPQSITGAAELPSSSGLSIASFLLGQAGAFGRIIYPNVAPTANQKRYGYFIQDTWHVTPKLTAVLGLRYDYMGWPTSSQKGNISNFDFTDTDAIIQGYPGGGPTAGINENWFDFGPRVGLAYRVTPKTVVRTGYARSFTVGFYGANFGATNNSWPVATHQNMHQTSPYFPVMTLGSQPPAFVSGFEILAAAGNPGRYPTPRDEGIWGTDPHNPTASVDQWNFTIERQLGSNSTLTASYVGNATRHLFYRINHNAVPPGPGPQLLRYPYAKFNYYANAYDQSNQSSSGYEGLQLNFVKRYSQGLSITTAVTWSRAYDFGLHSAFNQFNSRLDRGPQDGERALVISVGHVWELPFGSGKPFLANSTKVVNALVSGWKWSGITRWMSGDPLTPFMGNAASLNSTCCTLRPDRIKSGFVANPTTAQWFDVTAFVPPPLYTFGNSGRGILRGPEFWTADWALARDIKIGETRRIQFQWEVLNAFNHANLSDPNMAVDSSTAGMIFGIAQGMRTQQFGIHLFW